MTSEDKPTAETVTVTIDSAIPQADLFARDQPAIREGPARGWDIGRTLIDFGSAVLGTRGSLRQEHRIRDAVLIALLRRALIKVTPLPTSHRPPIRCAIAFLLSVVFLLACGSGRLDITGRWLNADSLATWPLFYEFNVDGTMRQATRDCSEVGFMDCRNSIVPIDTITGVWELRRSDGDHHLCIATRKPIRCHRISIISVHSVQELQFGPPQNLPADVLQELPPVVQTYRRAPN